MSRRMSLPGANELFRSTGDGLEQPVAEPAPGAAQQLLSAPGGVAAPDQNRGDQNRGDQPAVRSGPATGRPAPGRRRVLAGAERRPTGRERHDEKITVYISPEELMDLDRARLSLRGDHGLAVDRGRIVREALSVALADLEARGEASTLVRRLRGR